MERPGWRWTDPPGRITHLAPWSVTRCNRLGGKLKPLIVRRSRAILALIVLGCAVTVVVGGLLRGHRRRVGVSSAIGTCAVLTSRHGDSFSPIFAWSGSFLGVYGILAFVAAIVKRMGIESKKTYSLPVLLGPFAVLVHLGTAPPALPLLVGIPAPLSTLVLPIAELVIVSSPGP